MKKNYANTLIENFSTETQFFYASASDSLRADGEIVSTSVIEESYDFLDWKKKKNPKQAKIVGAIPFHSSSKARLILPQKIIEGGAAFFPENIHHPPALHSKIISQNPGPEKFKENVENVLSALGRHSLQKVVLSRMLEISVEENVDIQKLLFNLLSKNRLGQVFYLKNSSNLASSALVGASPELVLSKRGHSIYSNPLAGSIPRSQDPIEDYTRGRFLLNSLKDLHEHELVVKAMAEILGPFCSSLDVPNSPSLISTPRMWHLSTKIRGILLDPEIDSLRLARSLHPTPAVCGYPTEPARQLIQKLEGYDRQFYTGLIGWMDEKGDGDWTLTIRCAEVAGNIVRIYSGAGIVEGSDPQKELDETYSKLGTLCDAIGIKLQ